MQEMQILSKETPINEISCCNGYVIGNFPSSCNVHGNMASENSDCCHSATYSEGTADISALGDCEKSSHSSDYTTEELSGAFDTTADSRDFDTNSGSPFIFGMGESFITDVVENTGCDDNSKYIDADCNKEINQEDEYTTDRSKKLDITCIDGNLGINKLEDEDDSRKETSDSFSNMFDDFREQSLTEHFVDSGFDDVVKQDEEMETDDIEARKQTDASSCSHSHQTDSKVKPNFPCSKDEGFPQFSSSLPSVFGNSVFYHDHQINDETFHFPNAQVCGPSNSSSDSALLNRIASLKSDQVFPDGCEEMDPTKLQELLKRRRSSLGTSRVRKLISRFSLRDAYHSVEEFVTNSFRRVFKTQPVNSDASISKQKIKEKKGKPVCDSESSVQKNLRCNKVLPPGYKEHPNGLKDQEGEEDDFSPGWVQRRVTKIERIIASKECGENTRQKNACENDVVNEENVKSSSSLESLSLEPCAKRTIPDLSSGIGEAGLSSGIDVENLGSGIGKAGLSSGISENPDNEALLSDLETMILDSNTKEEDTSSYLDPEEVSLSSYRADTDEETPVLDRGQVSWPLSTDSADQDSTDTETEEDTIELRSNRGIRASSFYRYSCVRRSCARPRTVIVGVCTETHFLTDSFGDGVSETESEDEEDDGAPATHHHHHHNNTSSRPQSRAPSPARIHHHSRPHSPFSDMDTESKRNSQAVSTEPSEIDDHSSVTTSDLESCHDPSSPRSSLLATETTHTHHLDHAIDHGHDARKDKAYRIALELLHTERTYVKVLHLIDQEFQFRVDNENRAHHMFPQDIIPHMFSNVKSIYKLHHDFLLPQLEDRMAQWEQNRRIGDIMKSFAPFLKMYTEYVRNFDNAMTLINQWQSKCPRFAAIMDEIHSMEACANLTLQHHMLSPVQRIPRYEMLIRDYLKKLPEESPDRHDTEKALQLVSMAANHANDAMKKIDKFEKLLEIQESLGGAVDLVSPTRELVKEGKIIKISARSGDHQERYVFLLTDLLLLCSPRLMGARVMSGPQYRLRAKYNVDNLQVLEGDNLETANTFYIRDNNKSVELYTQTKEEKELWLEALFQAIHETYQRKSSLKLHFSPDQRVVDVDLGQKQPTLVRSDSVTKCMECGSQFTMVRRKHHCRACGAVVCNKCSSFKASLAYESGKNVRVCRTCHTTLQELSSSTATPSPEIDDSDECAIHSAKEQSDMAFRSRGVLEVSAKTGGAVMEGFLQLKTHRKAWVKRWFALHTDFVLYSFKCEADDQALTATPVPGFTVTHLQGTRNESGISDKEKERAFKLHHSKKHYIFQAASKEESQRWVAALKKASQAELPSPVQ
ncbi:uncharacterized protein [Palaemon carinicauda]|uniref:uncharacterized protein isoform X1 n=1 Tax=Palaemon carinicauda TaxID=392227 RepID=UPI0035B61654